MFLVTYARFISVNVLRRSVVIITDIQLWIVCVALAFIELAPACSQVAPRNPLFDTVGLQFYLQEQHLQQLRRRI